MANVKLKAPENISGDVMVGSKKYEVAGDKTVSVPEEVAADLIRAHGFKSVSDAYNKDQAIKH